MVDYSKKILVSSPLIFGTTAQKNRNLIQLGCVGDNTTIANLLNLQIPILDVKN